MPRIGLVWRLDDKTAFRAGHGRFVTPAELANSERDTLGEIDLAAFNPVTSPLSNVNGVPVAFLPDPFRQGLTPAYNPIARAQSAEERWWSKGHGTLVEGPDGRFYVVYHAYEKGFLTLGRQTLLEPVEWTSDGWVKLAGLDPARPIRKPKDEKAAVHGFAFSGDFTASRMGVQWSFYDGGQER